MERARGRIDATMMVMNGTRIALIENSKINMNHIMNAVRVMADTAMAIIESFESSRFKKLNLRIQRDSTS